MHRPEVDPSHATSPDIKRRSFVTIAAAATAGLATAAQNASVRASIVPEEDPGIVVDRPVLTVGGARVDAYAAWPKTAGPKTPSVVVTMHVWGVDTSMREIVRRLAAAGFAAIAPDLYARFGAPSGDGSTDASIFRPYAQRLVRSQYVGDLRAAATWLDAKFPQTRSAILGFCMGGRIALQTAQDTGTSFFAVCPFYGSFDGVDPKAMHVPACGSYGARDTSIPADDVRAFFAALAVAHDLRIYDEAGHAFMDDHRPSYVASAAADAWARTINFLRLHAKGPGS